MLTVAKMSGNILTDARKEVASSYEAVITHRQAKAYDPFYGRTAEDPL